MQMQESEIRVTARIDEMDGQWLPEAQSGQVPFW